MVKKTLRGQGPGLGPFGTGKMTYRNISIFRWYLRIHSDIDYADVTVTAWAKTVKFEGLSLRVTINGNKVTINGNKVTINGNKVTINGNKVAINWV